MTKLILFSITLLISLSAMGLPGTSLQWQKLALEEKVQRKFNNALSAVLKENQFLVEIETEVSDPGAPNFGNKPPTGPRVSDLDISESRGDYIAFSKIGLEVPVVDKFLDEDRTKLTNLYKFNETYDLFKSISSIIVTIYFSDKIPAPLLDIAKKVAVSSKLNVAGIKPIVKFENIALEWIDPEELKRLENAKKERPKNPEQEEPKIWAKDWLEWASRWGNAFGLILASTILAAIAYVLFKQWKAFMEAFIPKKPEEQDDKEADELANAEAENLEDATQEDEDVAAIHGLERFKQVLEQHPEDAINIVRSWINDAEEMSVLALRALSQQTTTEEMEKLLGGLSDGQRDRWKSFLGAQLDQAQLNVANKHMFQEVVRFLLVPSKIKDGELLNLLMEMDAKLSCSFLTMHEDKVGIMMNLMGPAIVAKIMSEVEENVAESWLNKGSEFPMKTLEDQLPKLKEALLHFKDKHGPTPFTNRLMSMIPTSTPSREGTLFRALAKAGNESMVTDVAKRCFPSELVMDLPGPLIREVIQSYPIEKRVEFLASRPEDVRTTLLDNLAAKGTPGRDMIDMELENVVKNASLLAGIENRSEEIWHDFVKLTRNILSKQPAYTSVADGLVKEWVKNLKGGFEAISGGKAA